MHLAGPGRHVDADGAVQSVLLPLEHVAVGRPRLHEAVRIALMAGIFAAAETGHVARDLRMLGRKLIGGGHDLRRTWRRVSAKRNRRKVRLLVRPECRDCPVAASTSGVGFAAAATAFAS